jgi:hypothetical protein
MHVLQDGTMVYQEGDGVQRAWQETGNILLMTQPASKIVEPSMQDCQRIGEIMQPVDHHPSCLLLSTFGHAGEATVEISVLCCDYTCEGRAFNCWLHL